MASLIARALPFLWCGLAAAADVKDAPIPETMNWVGVAAFALVFFGLCIGFVVVVWLKSRAKPDDKKPEA